MLVYLEKKWKLEWLKMYLGLLIMADIYKNFTKSLQTIKIRSKKMKKKFYLKNTSLLGKRCEHLALSLSASPSSSPGEGVAPQFLPWLPSGFPLLTSFGD